MLPISTLLATIDLADREYWLSHCEGFHVRSGSRRLGVVDFVRHESDPRLPDTIHVCAGITRIREIAIPVEDVERLDPRRQTVWVRCDAAAQPWRAGGRAVAWLHRATERARRGPVPPIERKVAPGSRRADDPQVDRYAGQGSRV